MPVEKDEFRTALGRFASGVTVITVRTADQQPHGMTVSAFSSLSLEPPLVLVCIDKNASLHPCLKEGDSFAVNILSEEQETVSRRFASREGDRFDGIGYALGVLGSPLLEGAMAHLECKVKMVYPGGDHTIFVGEVEATTVAEGRPLTYYRGGYARLS
ncbi:MAG TPA: flavin reductase family protein [Blastocatellia bacterium]|nr:flavin reductase family protein [Blastocatellia bacterium]